MVGTAHGEVPAFDSRPFRAKAGDLFRPELLTGPESPLIELAENALLLFQALAIIAVVAGIVWKIQKERTQLEGLATALLTVAFIATVSLWSEQVLGASQAMADSLVAKEASANASAPPPVVSDLWRLVEQWVPPGSPYLDVLETQAATPPPSGTETDWALRGWNWARGVGVADASLLQGVWQAGSGGLRAGIVFGICALAVCATTLMIALTYFAEVVRHVLLCGGVALLPVFIAGFSLDALRGQAARYCFGLGAIAFWPVGWALAGTVSQVLIDRTVSWMQSVSSSALGLQAGVTPPALAMAAPFVAWGALLLLLALSLGLCGWVLFSVVYIPILMSRAAAAGVGYVSGEVSSASVALTAPSRPIVPARAPSPSPSPRTLLVPRTVVTAIVAGAPTPASIRAAARSSAGSTLPGPTSRPSGARRRVLPPT